MNREKIYQTRDKLGKHQTYVQVISDQRTAAEHSDEDPICNNIDEIKIEENFGEAHIWTRHRLCVG